MRQVLGRGCKVDSNWIQEEIDVLKWVDYSRCSLAEAYHFDLYHMTAVSGIDIPVANWGLAKIKLSL